MFFCVSLFLVKDDDEDEINVKQASCRADLSTSRSSASLQPAEIFAADSGTVSFGRCSLKV